MKRASVMIKPASGLCNLRCRYCFYSEVTDLRKVKSYGIMSEDVMKKLIGNVLADLNDGDDITFAFQGGEPTLAGLAYFRAFAAEAAGESARQHKRLSIHYTIQTNGILMDDEWCVFLKENSFLVGLSLDGDQEMHDMNRMDASGNGTFSRVMHTKELFDKHRIDYNIMWVLTEHHAQQPDRVWRFITDNNIGFVQFIPCLSEIQGEADTYDALSPEKFCSFYDRLFRLWYRSLRKGQYISVKFFDDIFNLMLRNSVTACGFTGRCSAQMIVEADGGVYPCDFYVLDQWKSGSFVNETLDTIRKSPATERFLKRDKKLPEFCKSCRWIRLCGGGCPRMRGNMYVDEGRKFCGYREFLNRNSEKINEAAAFISIGCI